MPHKVHLWNIGAIALQAGGAATGWFFPLAPLFIYLLMLMVFNFVVALGAVLTKPHIDYRAFLATGVQRVIMLVMAKFAYITDKHMSDLPMLGFDAPLGPLVTGWFCVHVAIKSLQACEDAGVPLGPLASVLAVLKAKETAMDAPPAQNNLAEGGPLFKG